MYFPPGPNLLNLDALGSIYLGVLAQQTSNDANGNPVTSTLWGALCQISGDVANPPYSETQLSPPSPPLSNGGLTDDFFFLNPDGGNANAYCAGAVGEINVTNGYCQLLYSQGSFTIFDFTDDIGIPPTVTGNNAISDADFWPTMCNAQGQAIDNIDDLLWDGTGVQTPPSRPVALNDQYDVLCAADLCTNGVTSGTNTTLAGKVPAAFAAEVQNLKGVAVSNRNTAATGQQPLLNVVASGNIDRSGKGTNWQPTQFLFQELANNTWTASEIPNSVGLQVKAINSSGVIAAIGNPPGSTGGNGLHALLLLPVQLTQTNYPTTAGEIDPGVSGTETISSGTTSNSVAYITGSAAMPTLQVEIANGSLSGMQVQWWMTVTSERADLRGTQDNVTVPVPQVGYRTLPINQPWEIDNDYGGQFFGGTCTIHYIIQDSSGNALTPTQQFQFLIRGKNPPPATAHSYIQAEPFAASTLYYAWGVAKHESAQDTYNAIYCQFNAGGSTLSLPNYGYPNGWGIFQRDDSGGAGAIPVTTAQVYSWKVNSDVAVQQELYQKWTRATKYLANLSAKYPTQYQQDPPPTYTTGNGTVFAAMDTLTMEAYSGAGRFSALLSFYPSNAHGNRWAWHLPNAPQDNEPYVSRVAERMSTSP